MGNCIWNGIMSASSATSWALVTGASSGIGRATAEELAAKGHAIVLVARDAVALANEAKRLRDTRDVPVMVVTVDFAEPSAAAAVDHATRDLPIDIAVLAAGYGSVGRFLDQSLADEVAMVQVNCASVVALSGLLLARFTARGRGQLVLYGSIVGFGGVAYSATYAATKNFVQAFAEGLQREVAGTGVQVLCVAPGPTDTGFARRAKMQMGQAPGPEVVARATVAALPSNGTIRPGGLSKLLHYSLATLGRRGRSLVLGHIMRGMAKPA